mmetsp:Transcript_21514/g.43189  ORF Transcript_21514/g.43189 Transcript_21514/m.43189 type:complete len:133 (-) Transcript_21514:680-1078(-)
MAAVGLTALLRRGIRSRASAAGFRRNICIGRPLLQAPISHRLFSSAPGKTNRNFDFSKNKKKQAKRLINEAIDDSEVVLLSAAIAPLNGSVLCCEKGEAHWEGRKHDRSGGHRRGPEPSKKDRLRSCQGKGR